MPPRTQRKTDDMIGMRLDNFTIKRLIAKGGMGRVYEAIDTILERTVAIKIITLEEDIADEMMDRFFREAKAIGQLDSHPNIINVYRYGKAKNITYIAMQYVRGESLADYVRKLREEGKFIPPEEMIHLLRQVAGALDYAHEKGVIHRDVKPANVMLEDDPNRKGRKRAILMDFGLVLRVDNTMTTGSAFGTPRYISPEQALSSADACPQSDIYSLGIMVYEMLAGRPPFEDEDTPIGVALSHVTKPPPNPKSFRAELPEAIVPVLMKVLEKEPEKRYQTASEFILAAAKAMGVEVRTGTLSVTPAVVEEQEDDGTLMQAPQDVRKTLAQRDETSPTLPPEARKWLPVGIGIAVVVVLILAGMLLFSSGGDKDNKGDGGGNDTLANNSDGGDTQEGVVPVERNGEVELFYSNGALAIRNPSSHIIDLTNLVLKQGNTQFSLEDFGKSLLEKWGIGQCAYVQMFHIDYDTLETGCSEDQTQPPLLYIRDSNFVWLKGDSFEVIQDGENLGRCDLDKGYCLIHKIKQSRAS